MITDQEKTQRQIAVEERDLYEACTREERGFLSQAKYISQKTGVSQFAVTLRSSLLRAGSHANVLWEEIDAGRLKLSQARDILHEAKVSGRTVAEMLLKYRQIEQRKADLGVQGARLVDVVNGVAPARPPKVFGPWQKIREAVAEVLSEASLDEDEREHMLKVMMAEIETVISGFQSRIRGARGRSVSWSKVRDACTLLSIAVPKRGKACDLMAARKHQRSVLKVSHPDVVGDESGRAAYQAVVDAYNILVLYNDSLISGREK